ncbi:ethanolamine kinase 2-like [Lineus longissimus]|uniref:ethanolamine kinase 2-like n=1 Tax=Lineus longissimus TaxID=88925 RepID=UPI002B4ECADE
MDQAIDDITLDVTVDTDNPDEGVFKIIATVKPDWEPETITKKPLEEGTVNVLYKYWDTRFDEAIVVRVFGDGLSQYLNKEEEVKAYRLLGHIESAPKLLCLFKNGMCTQFVNGEIFSVVKAGKREADIKLAKAVAREIAAYHCEKTTKLALEKFNISGDIRLYGIWQQCMDDWTLEMEEAIPILKSEEFPSKSDLQKELETLKKMVEDLKFPLVFCHNDLHPGNAIYDEEKDKATLVDFEFCSFYFSGFDLAFYLFYSVFGLGNRPSPELPQMHPVEYQTEFLRDYLQTLSRLDNWSRDVTDDDVEQLRKNVDIFILIVMLVHIPILLVIAAKPTVSKEDALSIPWGCLKCWKVYLKKRKEVLGY